MKKISKKDKKFAEMLNAERKYRAATSGNDADEPFITPILFSLLDALNFVGYGLFFVLGVLLAFVAMRF